jgi:hypothetical protein
MRLRFATTVLHILVGLAAATAQTALQNGGFESGSPGQEPPGWFVPPPIRAAGYQVQITAENPKEGRQCLCISLPSRSGNGFGNVMQSLPATRFRGKTVRFRAAVRYENGDEPGRAALWFRVDRPGGQMGFFDNMGNRPITSSSWAFYDIVGRIDPDAETINVGMMMIGGGRAFLDSATLELSDVVEEPVVKARALTDRGLVNLVAFTKLYGYVRHFHPSDAVEKANWNAYAMAGVTVAEDARDPADLAQRLTAFFASLAPTVQVYATGSPPPPAVKAPASSGPFQIVSWENFGFGGGVTPPAQNIYHSRRVFVDRKAGALDPLKPFEADLGAGVSCRVPIALFAQDGRALPPTTEPPTPTGVRVTPTGNDRTTRLADVVIAWNVYEHFYPYFDVVKTDWPAQLTQALTSAANDADERAFLDTLRRLVASARDGHGYVGHPSDDGYATPPLLADWVEGKFVVTTVGPDVTRIRPGDVIASIDGTSVDEAWKAKETLIAGATEQWRRSRGAGELLRGPSGSSVEFEIRRGSDAPFKISLLRVAGVQLREKRPKPIEELKVGLWYVDLDGARANMAEYQKAIHDLAGAEGIVFDMRGYPNDVAMDVLPRLAKQPITSALWNVPRVVRPDRLDVQYQQSRWPEMAPQVPRFRGKVAFITDGRVISYAESVMGMVENYKLGEIVGEPTAGTNGNVNPFALPGGYTVVFTGMKVLKHDGSVHHGVGIQPTILVHRTIAGVAAGRDEMLEAAVAAVRK